MGNEFQVVGGHTKILGLHQANAWKHNWRRNSLRIDNLGSKCLDGAKAEGRGTNQITPEIVQEFMGLRMQPAVFDERLLYESADLVITLDLKGPIQEAVRVGCQCLSKRLAIKW